MKNKTSNKERNLSRIGTRMSRLNEIEKSFQHRLLRPLFLRFLLSLVLIQTIYEALVLDRILAGMSQRWERSPPTNVARVRFPDRCHMWIEIKFIVGSLLCSERFFPGYPWCSVGRQITLFLQKLQITFPNEVRFVKNTPSSVICLNSLLDAWNCDRTRSLKEHK